jgi:hypothetical protein
VLTAVEASGKATDDSEAAVRYGLSTAVDHFPATGDMPEGIIGIATIDSDS